MVKMVTASYTLRVEPDVDITAVASFDLDEGQLTDEDIHAFLVAIHPIGRLKVRFWRAAKI